MAYVLRKVEKRDYPSIAEYRLKTLAADAQFDGCSSLEDYEDIEKWDLNCKLFEDLSTVPPGYSLGFQYVYAEAEDVVGMLNIRPLALSHAHLKEFGGHIGYSVRPDKRNQGIAKMMLKDALRICKDEFMLDRVLITALEDNYASQKVITDNGGVFENSVFYAPEDKNIKRYWISL